MANIGFIGFGMKGAPTVRNWQAGDHTLFAYKRAARCLKRLMRAAPINSITLCP